MAIHSSSHGAIPKLGGGQASQEVPALMAATIAPTMITLLGIEDVSSNKQLWIEREEYQFGIARFKAGQSGKHKGQLTAGI
ncbi:MAG TPA: hypothetical protein VI386_07370 [Candidatus Sulfotelmatobacter sp.]